ncbi:Cof-type HAD-IIB family hydrolase [Neolewinella antarctica]|uniref:Uncharacterized protein n=1 Tax=Neolewinella antarctica TaxID=442734 RepID=A0ABX0XB04_9BACT|nr:Cof-type HAD-IIB family hydrolase [Neolewinella antarctica]NJC26453.1 hypothetical protein [Neolewinella antarctica]
MIKIAFSDIDGTLLDKDRRISPATHRAVDRLTKHDIPFVLISSRMPRAMTHLQDDLGISGQPLIAYNGGLVVVDGKTIFSRAIPIGAVATVRELNEQLSFSTSLYHADEWYVPSLDHYAKRETHNTRTEPTVRALGDTIRSWTTRGIGAHKIMCMGEATHLDRVTRELKSRHPGSLHLYRSKDDYLEIAAASISKLTGISTLLTHHYPNINLKECIAFGDNYNDIAMLAGVGTGVAVGNARPEVKAVADHIVAGNKDDGVAEGLDRLISFR